MNETQFIDTSEAAKHFPKRNGKKLHTKTIVSRIRSGKLKGKKSGGHYYTTI